MIASISEWLTILLKCGVSQTTAANWAMVFAATIKNDTFSSGSGELPDFLSTIMHESGRLQRLKEDGYYSASRIRELGNASGPNTRWRSLVPKAEAIACNPPAFFEACYGGRLGNDQPGDGALYYGRGLIMVTGKANYAWLGDHSGQDLLGIPDLLTQPHYALELSIDWWEGRVPDTLIGDEKEIRRIVNGGDFGLADVAKLVKDVRGALA